LDRAIRSGQAHLTGDHATRQPKAQWMLDSCPAGGRKMRGRTLFGLTVVLGIAMSAAAAPVEQPYDLIRCSSGTFVTASASDELTVGSFEEFGIARSNHTNKLFDNWPFHCVRIQRVMGSQATVSGYCKYLAPNGDFVVGEFTSVGTEGQWRFLQGT